MELLEGAVIIAATIATLLIGTAGAYSFFKRENG
jgi:hypothetical protein